MTLDKFKGATYLSMFDIFNDWQQMAEKRKNGELTEDEYNAWRYNFPRAKAKQAKAALDESRAEKDNA